MKGSFEADGMVPADFALYAQVCGSRERRPIRRCALIAGYLGARDTFDRAIVEFAEAYADQTERDHAALVEAIRSGRVSAREGI